jgi:hypothetical protein
MSPEFESTLRWLGIVASFSFAVYLLWLFVRAQRMRPRFEPADVVFQERFASGCSQKNLITKLGGARHCLRLVVTRSVLWVTSWFPFSLFTSFYDLEHVIPLDAIVSVRRSSVLGRATLLLTFRDAEGNERTLRLLPQRPEAFIQSLGVKIEA